VNIYQWLPFSQQDLAQASDVATRFGAYYQTYSYNDSAAAYAARMQSFATSQLLQTLENGYSALGVAQQRTSQKKVSSGSAVIDSLRAFGPSSLSFVVAITAKVSGTTGTTETTTQYQVTVVKSGGIWQANDIQPASAGNL
jgi:ABC-type uncharacterized transport system YnjBCD substrate-binding protein